MTPHVSYSGLKKKRLDLLIYFLTVSLFSVGIPPPPPSLLLLIPRIPQTRFFFSPHFTTMSNIHKVLNVLLRGLVIYAVLGLECTYSDDLPSQPSDAANVATTGKAAAIHVGYKCLQFIYACTPPSLLSSPLLICLPHLPLVPCGFLGGKAEESPAQGGWGGGLRGKVMHFMSTFTFFSLPPPPLPPLLYIGKECMT